MKRRGFHFDDMSSLLSLKDENIKKFKRMMLATANLKDRSVIEKIYNLLRNLTTENMIYFNNYLKHNCYLPDSNYKAHPEAFKIANFLEQLIVGSVPNDKYLADLVEKFNFNLDKIQKFKNVLAAKNWDEEQKQKVMFLSDKLNEANVKLFSMVENYNGIPPKE